MTFLIIYTCVNHVIAKLFLKIWRFYNWFHFHVFCLCQFFFGSSVKIVYKLSSCIFACHSNGSPERIPEKCHKMKIELVFNFAVILLKIYLILENFPNFPYLICIADSDWRIENVVKTWSCWLKSCHCGAVHVVRDIGSKEIYCKNIATGYMKEISH